MASSIKRPVFDNPFLNITTTPDSGSVHRPAEPRTPADSDPGGTSPVLSRDVTLDSDKGTWLRLYIPRQDKHNTNTKKKKLPVIVYYHGGGFVFCNADTTVYDVFCKGLVEKAGVMVVSLDYRLAPEHRLPSAYEDAVDGLFWLKTTRDEWVRDYADLTRCYLSGTSSGGNLAYHAGLRAAAVARDLSPLTIRGLILHHPYFSGAKRTPSEERLANDTLLPLYAIDQMFDLCLPEGVVDHDHEYCNPLVNGGSSNIRDMVALGWRVLVTGCFDDPLVDAAAALADMLEEKGVNIMRLFIDGYHAMEVFDPSMVGPLYVATNDFLSSH